MTANISAIVALASSQAFDRPLITNVFRGHVVEAIIASALNPAWTWCSADYASWDFQHTNGSRLEIKQSAMRQTWNSPRAVSPRWDIAPRPGFWQGEVYTARPGRNADIYVLGLHPVTDDTADHRDPEQWRFYVIASADLPIDGQSIGRSSVEKLTSSVGIADLNAAISGLMPSSSTVRAA